MTENDIDIDRLNSFTPEEGYLDINEKNNLKFDGIDCVDLARKFDTPLYVISEKRLRHNLKKISRTFKNYYENTKIAYAYKANPTMGVCKILKDEGAMAEVISLGELILADLTGFEGSDIIFNGVNKDIRGIRLAIKMGSLINVDSLNELDIIEREAKNLGVDAKIGIRINPVVKTGTLAEWETALESSKFGINIDNGLKAYKKAKELDHIDIRGIHAHIGSQIEDVTPYKTAAERVMNFLNELKRELGVDIEVLDLGGGFPLPHRYKDIPPLKEYAETITKVIIEKVNEFDLHTPTLVLEPGGSIVGNTSVLLLEVGIVKNRENTVDWAYVDGGANIILRATQGWYVYQIVCCNKMDEPQEETYNIGGPLCYSGDVLGYERDLPELEQGDVLGVLDCGAYTMSIFNRYNSHPLPAVILIDKNGEVKVLRQRENFSKLIEGERILL